MGGSLLTGRVAAQRGGVGNVAIVQALNDLIDAVLGIDHTVNVPEDAIQVNVVGLAGPQGGVGPDGPQGLQGDKGPDGDAAPGAAPPCFNDVDRYVNCGNGTVTDTLTGLIWLQQANCFPLATYTVTNQAAAGLQDGDCSLTDGSSPGDWRLPTRDEWAATMARAVALGCRFGNAPTLTNDAGTACYSADGGASSSFAGVASHNYWSSSTDEDDPINAWVAFLFSSAVDVRFKVNTLRVWPVRSPHPH